MTDNLVGSRSGKTLVSAMNKEREVSFIKNSIQDKQDAELKRNARIARIKILEQKLRDWDVKGLGFAGLRKLKHQLADLKKMPPTER